MSARDRSGISVVTQIIWSRPSRLPHVYNGAHPAHIHREIIESSPASLSLCATYCEAIRNGVGCVGWPIKCEEMTHTNATSIRCATPFGNPPFIFHETMKTTESERQVNQTLFLIVSRRNIVNFFVLANDNLPAWFES